MGESLLSFDYAMFTGKDVNPPKDFEANIYLHESHSLVFSNF